MLGASETSTGWQERPRPRWASNTGRRILGAALTLLLGAAGRGLEAQEVLAPQVDPRDLGIAIARDAETVPGNGRPVLVPDESDEVVVGRLSFESGDRRIVMLPSGRLTSVPARAITPTERPFEPLSQEEMAQRLVDGPFRGFEVKVSRRYVFVYNTSEEFVNATKQILETMYPKLVSYCEKQRLSVTEPEVPLVVIMFRTEKEFQAYRQMPEGVIAYYNGISNQVVMYEMSDLVEVAPTIALKQSISTIAHEGVHQILHNIGVQQRMSRWPKWISEGLPEFFAPTDVRKGFVWKGINEVNDLRLYNLRQQWETLRATLGTGDYLRSLVDAESLDSSGYAGAWGLTFFLAKYRSRSFYAYLREIEAIGPLESLDAGTHRQLFEKHFGDDWARLETEWLRQFSRLPVVDPVSNQPHFVIWLKIGPRINTFVTSSPQAVQQWRVQLEQQLSPAERAAAQVQVKVFANQALAKQAAQSFRP